MDLTKKQLEIMEVYWESCVPLTIPDVVKASGHRTWSANSIHKLIAQLEAKGALAVSRDSDTYVKSYEPKIEFKDYMVRRVIGANNDIKPSIRLTLDGFIEAVMKNENEWENE